MSAKTYLPFWNIFTLSHEIQLSTFPHTFLLNFNQLLRIYSLCFTLTSELCPYANDGRCLLGGGPFSRTAALLSHNYMIHQPPYEEYKWIRRDLSSEFDIQRFITHIHSYLLSVHGTRWRRWRWTSPACVMIQHWLTAFLLVLCIILLLISLICRQNITALLLCIHIYLVKLVPDWYTWLFPLHWICVGCRAPTCWRVQTVILQTNFDII